MSKNISIIISELTNIVNTQFKNNQNHLKFMDKIFTNQEFINNPSDYVSNWIVERGLTEEYRTIEDPLLNTFTTYFQIDRNKITNELFNKFLKNAEKSNEL